MAWLQKGLAKSSNKLTSGLSVFGKRKLDHAALEELEDILIESDMGVDVATHIVAQLSKERFDREVTGEIVTTFMADLIADLVQPVAKSLQLTASKPHVILCVGVNGNGKTTSVGKMAYLFKQQGLKVCIAACDTFRAAAVEQVEYWGDRVGVPTVVGKPNQDPASVAYEALEYAQNQQHDVLLIDTAGRLQTKKDLMLELDKIKRVLQKLDVNAPHHSLLVLDANTGQNAFSQMDHFQEAADINGLIVTKLDGTAKGGVIVGLAQKYTVPIYLLGVGEGIEDLQPFTAQEFAQAMVKL